MAVKQPKKIAAKTAKYRMNRGGYVSCGASNPGTQKRSTK